MATGLELKLLGKLEIHKDGVRLSGFVSSKAEALLCYLALSQESYYRNQLLGLLWPEASESEAKASLRVHLSNLRRLLGSHLNITRQTVAFNRNQPYHLDIETFIKALDKAKNDGNHQDLNRAIGMYRGDFLDGFYVRDAPDFEAWVLSQREALREEAIQALSQVIEKAIESRMHQEAIDYAKHLLKLDTWREEAYRHLMLCLARTGQRSAALMQYEICCRVLSEELGVEPTADTVALYNRIRLAQPTRTQHLPNPPNQFIGRENELSIIENHLSQSDHRLLSLVGPGGIGKTRLALEIAHIYAQKGYFLDGVYFIPLANRQKSSHLALHIAAGLDFAFYNNEGPEQQLLNFLRDKEMLLILDNFEDSHGESHLITQILNKAFHIKLIITTQHRLQWQGSSVLELSGLAYSKEGQAPLQSASQLFIGTAQRLNPQFSPRSQDQEAILRLCHLLDGMPLGLELAASWTRVLSCQEIVEEIEKNLDFLEGRQHNRPQRHRSLRAVFNYAWQRLSTQEQLTFQKLSCFENSFQREAGLSVAQTDLKTLTQLVDKSFLSWQPPQNKEKQGRYQAPYILTRYAQTLMSREKDLLFKTQLAHAQYFMAYLQNCEKALQGGEQQESIARIRAEIDNIRQAWRWLCEEQQIALLNQGLKSLFMFYEIQTWYEEALESFSLAESSLRQVDLSPALGRILSYQALFYYRLANYEKAQGLLQEGLNYLTTGLTSSDRAFALNQLGNLAQAQGDYESAQKFYQDSLNLKQALKEPYEIAIALNNLGYVAYLSGAYDQAEAYYSESISLCQAIQDYRGLALTLNNQGLRLHAQGDYAQAETTFQESLNLCEAIQDQYVMTLALNNLGRVAEAQGDSKTAKQRYEATLALGQKTGDQALMGLSLSNLGGHALSQKEYDLAKQRFVESLGIQEKINNPLGQVYCWQGLGRVALAQADRNQAQDCFAQALNLAYAIQAIPAVLDVLLAYAQLFSQGQGPEKCKAVRYLSFIQQHPASEKDLKAKASKMLSELASLLPQEIFEQAQRDGKALYLEDILQAFDQNQC